LLDAGILVNTSTPPTVVNPLTVAENAAGKKRLVLDLRTVNPLIHVHKFKFEDLKVASNYFSAGCYMCSFDLKSGYHHIDVHPAYQQYLGLSWQGSYYMFTSVAFGLSSAGVVFSKVLKELVKKWRANSIPVLLYLDDGLIIARSADLAAKYACIIKTDLTDAGFIINELKSHWVPTQTLHLHFRNSYRQTVQVKDIYL
jgi:hypothetical protein